MTKKAIITTSANPFHKGHLDIYYKAKDIFDDVTIIVACNSEKSLTVDMKRIKYHLLAYGIPFEILDPGDTVADYCKNNNITNIVRGIRNGVDADYELKIDFVNREIFPYLQTVFIPTSDKFRNISSSVIRELLQCGKGSIVEKYMDIDAMYRYKNGNYKWRCFFGKSCVGKTTYLSKDNTPFSPTVTDIDQYLWKVFAAIHGDEESQFYRKKCREIFYSSTIDKRSKIDMLTAYARGLLTEPFWTAFFEDLQSTEFLDWASVGYYWHFIPVEYRSKMEYVELICPDDVRQKRIKAKGFENKVKYLDELYTRPAIVDCTISLTGEKEK